MLISDFSWQMKVMNRQELNQKSGMMFAYLMKDIASANTATTTKIVYANSEEEAIKLFVDSGLCPTGKPEIILTAETGETAQVADSYTTEVEEDGREVDDGDAYADNSTVVGSSEDGADGAGADLTERTAGSEYGDSEAAGGDSGNEEDSGVAEDEAGTGEDGEGDCNSACSDEYHSSEEREVAESSEAEPVDSLTPEVSENPVAVEEEESSTAEVESPTVEEEVDDNSLTPEELSALFDKGETEDSDENEVTENEVVEESSYVSEEEETEQVPVTEEDSVTSGETEVEEESSTEEVSEESVEEDEEVQEESSTQPASENTKIRIRLVSTGELSWDVNVPTGYVDWVKWVLDPTRHNLIKSEPGQAAIFVDTVE